ncbi:restriction endonuclease subunit S [Marinomonas lutimaris]|uniref:restriction endonuclease subunit S n=1 Tax=Marinomonas lutimaris TaxID=2846746 RepID=UPI001CA49FE4|nr:restriction endonuclease subunit S [Marinomonas lutimaris]
MSVESQTTHSSPIENLITEHIDIWSSAIKRKSSSGRGSSKKIELYGIKKLRELILELAVRGKLVAQDPNDEPASVLLERIAKEKAQLVKEGKIKKPKKLPEITEDEKPFELPSGWEWCRIQEIGHDLGQKQPEGTFSYIDVGSIDKVYGLVESPTILEGKDAPSRARKIVTEGTVIYSTIRPYLLNIAIIDKKFSYEPIASTAFAIIHPLNGIVGNYVYRYLRSTPFVRYVESVQTGVAYPAINDKQFQMGIISVPPTTEQHRIVAKVDELMALCDKLEAQTESSLDAHQTLVTVLLDTLVDSQNAEELAQSWMRISGHFDTLFTTEQSIDQLKQTILQLAVTGKLVEQASREARNSPNYEPASVLLERIAAEKEELVKQKKIKKQKPLPPISDDEKPFGLPEGWEWVRFENIVEIQGGITKGRKLAGREVVKVPYLSVANVQRNYLDLNFLKEIEIPISEKEKYRVKKRDLLITEGGDWDKVGRTAIWSDELDYVGHQNHVFKARIFIEEQSEIWLEKYLNGPYARNYFAGSSKQTTNLASINKTQLRGCLIAIAPLEEQHRIVAKVDELMAICDQLKARLSEAQTTQLNLADALVEQAL